MIEYEFAKQNNIVEISRKDGKRCILSKNSLDDDVVSKLRKKLGNNIEFTVDKRYNFKKIFEETYSITLTDEKIKAEFKDVLTKDIESLFAYIMKKAYDFLSSDIHIIIEEENCTIKFRINSLLRTFAKIDINRANSLIRVIKLKSDIEITKTLSPLEGRFDYENLSYRVSIIPTVNAEKLSIRVLGNIKDIYTFADLGLNEHQIKILTEKITKSKGFIIVTGATGTGKSTTMFTILHYLNDGTKNIISIEDPVEYKIDGVTQIQVSQEKEIDFQNILKFVLRQDPQIINIGEIRDEDTAKIAVQSANTGHLVFSTMHTNDSISSISRLYDLGVEAFEIADALSLIISQKLIRILCPHCKKSINLDESILEHYKLDKEGTYYEKVGCPNCFHTGYMSQKAVFEFLDVDENVKEMIAKNELKLENINLITIEDEIKKLVQTGLTDIEEMVKYI
ncbi:type II/IV secretion system protein [[Eubacterium] yurii subsp. margaretiae ATCC 43715]|nr:type II/IV secretion system protein [[Eubacterium] yurii subsp. margaretiae ATCC 43715]